MKNYNEHSQVRRIKSSIPYSRRNAKIVNFKKIEVLCYDNKLFLEKPSGIFRKQRSKSRKHLRQLSRSKTEHILTTRQQYGRNFSVHIMEKMKKKLETTLTISQTELYFKHLHQERVKSAKMSKRRGLSFEVKQIKNFINLVLNKILNYFSTFHLDDIKLRHVVLTNSIVKRILGKPFSSQLRRSNSDTYSRTLFQILDQISIWITQKFETFTEGLITNEKSLGNDVDLSMSSDFSDTHSLYSGEHSAYDRLLAKLTENQYEKTEVSEKGYKTDIESFSSESPGWKEKENCKNENDLLDKTVNWKKPVKERSVENVGQDESFKNDVDEPEIIEEYEKKLSLQIYDLIKKTKDATEERQVKRLSDGLSASFEDILDSKEKGEMNYFIKRIEECEKMAGLKMVSQKIGEESKENMAVQTLLESKDAGNQSRDAEEKLLKEDKSIGTESEIDEKFVMNSVPDDKSIISGCVSDDKSLTSDFVTKYSHISRSILEDKSVGLDAVEGSSNNVDTEDKRQQISERNLKNEAALSKIFDEEIEKILDIKKVKSNVYKHSTDKICSYTLHLWAEWLKEVSINGSKWKLWAQKINQKLKLYTSILRGERKSSDGNFKTLYREEWEQFKVQLKIDVVSFKRYYSNYQDLSEKISGKFSKKNVGCCQTCLEYKFIANKRKGREVVDCLLNAVKRTDHFKKYLTKLVNHASTILHVKISKS